MTQRFNVGIVGTGRMAGALAALLTHRGVFIPAVAGRSAEAAVRVAERFPPTRAVPISELCQWAELVLLAVRDDALDDVAHELSRGGAAPHIALHTSGSAGPDALAPLRPHGTSIGVLHPLQTVPSAEAGMTALPGSTWAIAGDERARGAAHDLVNILSGTPLSIAAGRWQHYHAAAVMASNYQVALLDAALELMEAAGVARSAGLAALAPLATNTLANTVALGCEAALTGPIRRGDVGTVLRHMEALRSCPTMLQRLYEAAGCQTVALASRAGLPSALAGEIAQVLAGVSLQ